LFPADEATFNRLRYVEIKHGRVAQLASDTLSLLLCPSPRKYQPFWELFADIPDGFPLLAAIGGAELPRSLDTLVCLSSSN
jgi:hypothetical protein